MGGPVDEQCNWGSCLLPEVVQGRIPYNLGSKSIFSYVNRTVTDSFEVDGPMVDDSRFQSHALEYRSS